MTFADNPFHKHLDVCNKKPPSPSPGDSMNPQFDLEHIFSYHAPDALKQAQYAAIRNAAKTLAEAILAHSPPGADQAAAIRLLRETVMTANAAIALNGRLFKETERP